MRRHPTALAWVDPAVSAAPDGHRAQVQRLARHLGYVVIWAQADSVLSMAEQTRAVDADAVITPSPEQLDVLTLNAVMSIADVETVCPRLSFARWSTSLPEVLA